MSDLTSAIQNTIDSAVHAANIAVDAANVSLAQINAALTGPSTLNFAYVHAILNAPVGPGVVINLPSNTDSQLALTAPQQFQGTINLNDVPGVTPNALLPSYVGLIGVGADHWTFSTSTNKLTLFAGNQVTDTLNLVPSAAGFGVYAAPTSVGAGLPSGVVIASSALTVVPSVAVPLPGSMVP